ncbi:hypothetical protein [Streptomyces bacillaris]|uniref:hypothetical protein n=1 Tax=Streptomyces bacillaris TaxID=68179 RepID=UPI003EB891A3
MTTQPDRVHHLLDRLLRGVLLPEEAEQLAGAVRILQARVNDQDGAASVTVSAIRLMNQAGAQRDRAEACVRELEAEVARLTAGQCTHTRTLCGCGRPDPGACHPCPAGSPSLHCACVCDPAKTTP